MMNNEKYYKEVAVIVSIILVIVYFKSFNSNIEKNIEKENRIVISLDTIEVIVEKNDR
jgi:hypothetical protein